MKTKLLITIESGCITSIITNTGEVEIIIQDEDLKQHTTEKAGNNFKDKYQPDLIVTDEQFDKTVENEFQEFNDLIDNLYK